MDLKPAAKNIAKKEGQLFSNAAKNACIVVDLRKDKVEEIIQVVDRTPSHSEKEFKDWDEMSSTATTYDTSNYDEPFWDLPLGWQCQLTDRDDLKCVYTNHEFGASVLGSKNMLKATGRWKSGASYIWNYLAHTASILLVRLFEMKPILEEAADNLGGVRSDNCIRFHLYIVATRNLHGWLG